MYKKLLLNLRPLFIYISKNTINEKKEIIDLYPTLCLSVSKMILILSKMSGETLVLLIIHLHMFIDISIDLIRSLVIPYLASVARAPEFRQWEVMVTIYNSHHLKIMCCHVYFSMLGNDEYDMITAVYNPVSPL
jgi:hypothetical protein